MLREYVVKNIPGELPLIVAGDFNDWTGRSDGEFGESLGLKDAAVATRGTLARTFPSRLPFLPLDRIYCRGLTAKATGVYHRDQWFKLSDHAGLFAEVAFLRSA